MIGHELHSVYKSLTSFYLFQTTRMQYNKISTSVWQKQLSLGIHLHVSHTFTHKRCITSHVVPFASFMSFFLCSQIIVSGYFQTLVLWRLYRVRTFCFQSLSFLM